MEQSLQRLSKQHAAESTDTGSKPGVSLFLSFPVLFLSLDREKHVFGVNPGKHNAGIGCFVNMISKHTLILMFCNHDFKTNNFQKF